MRPVCADPRFRRGRGGVRGKLPGPAPGPVGAGLLLFRLPPIPNEGVTRRHRMHGRLLALLTSLVVLSCAGSGPVQAQSFYEGKTLRIIVGLAAGGGFDAYARVIARHMGKHIPGSPTIIVENMTGAGSLISANHLYRVAKPDGLTVAHFLGSLIFGQVLGQPGIG